MLVSGKVPLKPSQYEKLRNPRSMKRLERARYQVFPRENFPETPDSVQGAPKSFNAGHLVEILNEHDLVARLVVDQFVDERARHHQPEPSRAQPLPLPLDRMLKRRLLGI